jgi:integrase
VNDLLDGPVADYRQRGIKSLRQTIGDDGKGGHLKPIRAHFGSFRALAVTTDRIRRYIAARRKDGRSNAKINRETELLARAFKLAVEEEKLSYCPKIPALPEDNARQGFFERAEFDVVAGKLAPPLDDAARFAYATGWRRGEIVALRWENVDRSNREVRIATSKSGEPRSISLDEGLWQLMERRWTAREYEYLPGEPALSPYVFHRQGRPLGNFTKAWRAACGVRSGRTAGQAVP